MQWNIVEKGLFSSAAVIRSHHLFRTKISLFKKIG